MKRILLSLLIIAGIGGAMVAGARAFFSDTETSPDNVLAAGTIDISVDGQNPWQETLLTSDLPDLKPGMEKVITFKVKNEGENDLVLWKRINIKSRSQGTNTEPECIVEGGIWTGSECIENKPESSVDKEMRYSMNVNGVDTIKFDWYIFMSDLDQLWIPLGKINAGQTISVSQTYHLDETVGNEYQGDIITFDIDLYAEQLNGPGPSHTTKGVVLENKDTSDWAPIMDGTWGILIWDIFGNYTLKSWGLDNGLGYRIAYWDGSSESGVSSYGTPVSGYLEQNGSYPAFYTNTAAKYWLRPSDWDNVKTLWESNLVN